MSSRRKRKKRRPRQRPLTAEQVKKRSAFGRRDRPTPIQGIERVRAGHVRWLRSRSDELSQMLGQLAATRRVGDKLAVRVMDEATHTRLAELAEAGLPTLRVELGRIGEEVRRLLEEGDPIFLVCWVSFWNTWVSRASTSNQRTRGWRRRLNS